MKDWRESICIVPTWFLTDLQMPRMDGLALVAEMKKNHPQIPVVLMTSAGSDDIAVKALQAGAASYVPKKRIAQDLWDTVSNILDVSRERQKQAQALKRLNRWEADFTVETDLDLLMSVSGFLMQSFASMELCDSTEQVRVGVALAEALLNAFYHNSLELPKRLKESSRRIRKVGGASNDKSSLQGSQDPESLPGSHVVMLSSRFATKESALTHPSCQTRATHGPWIPHKAEVCC